MRAAAGPQAELLGECICDALLAELTRADHADLIVIAGASLDVAQHLWLSVIEEDAGAHRIELTACTQMPTADKIMFRPLFSHMMMLSADRSRRVLAVDTTEDQVAAHLAMLVRASVAALPLSE